MKEKINSSLDDAIAHIQGKQRLIDIAYSNPELIITKLYDPKLHQPYYDLFMKAIDNSDIRYHDIQNEFLQLIHVHFNNIDPNISVTKGMSMFPSMFIVNFMNEPILSFNIYKHVFGFCGKRSNSFTQKDIEINNGIIKENRDTVRKYKIWKNNLFLLYKENFKRKKPHVLIKHIVIDTYYFIMKKQELLDNLQKKIDGLEREIERRRKMNKQLKVKLKENNVMLPIIYEKYSEFREWFLKWGYEEKDRKELY